MRNCRLTRPRLSRYRRLLPAKFLKEVSSDLASYFAGSLCGGGCDQYNQGFNRRCAAEPAVQPFQGYHDFQTGDVLLLAGSENAKVVSCLCRLVSGLPLALKRASSG